LIIILNMKMLAKLLAIAMCLNMAQAAINECKQYLTCPECLGLNATRIDDFG